MNRFNLCRFGCGLLLGGCLQAVAADHASNVTVTPAAPSTPAGATAPPVIYVLDFHLPPEMIQPAKTVPERIGLGRGPLANVRRDMDSVRGNDPATKAGKLVTLLGQSIAAGLNKAGYRAEYHPGGSEPRPESFLKADGLPKEGWLVSGWFDQVRENNRAQSATVGFGAGSGAVSVEVAVSDLATDPREPFLRIGSASGTRRMPGGLVARNPYVVAAKFVLSRGEDEKDVREMGAAIASRLVDYLEQQKPSTRQP